jgi:hypothetical protein
VGDLVENRARIDVVFAADAMESEPTEVIRLVVDALEAGPDGVAVAAGTGEVVVKDFRFTAALREKATEVPALLCTLTNLGPALAQAAFRFASAVHHQISPEGEEEQAWTLRVVCAGNAGRFAAEDAYLAGVAVRGLLIELSHASELPSGVQLVLTEEAGFAQAAAGGFPDDFSALSAGSAAHRVDQSALNAACQRSAVGIVPQVSSS